MNRENRAGLEGNLFSYLTYRFLPYWPLFVVLIIICGFAAWGYVKYTTPLYEARATILVKDDKKGVNEAGIEETLNIFSSKKIVENEIEVIRSKKLMNEVVNELNLYAPVFEKGKVRVASAYNSSPVAIVAKNPESLNSTEDIPFSFQAGKVVVNNKSFPLNEWVVTPYGELKFIENPKKTTDPVSPLFFRLANPKNVAASFANRLDVKSSSKLSTVVTVSMKDEMRQRAEDVLNKLAEVYSKSSLEDKNNLALNTLSFVEKRLQAVEKELDSIESRIQHYRASKGVVNLSEQSKQFLDNVSVSDRKLADINMRLAVLGEVEKYVNSKDAASGIVPSTVGVEDPALSQLVQKLYNAELEYEKLRKTTGANNPLALPLAQEIEQIRPQIRESIKNQRNSLLASRNNVSATSNMYNSMLSTIPQKEREFADISRQQSIKSNVYSFLLQKREQTALSVTSNVSDSKVIDMATSSGKPVSPNVPVIYLAAIIAALSIGVGVVSIKEMLTSKIMFRSEIENYTKIPVAAEIPKVKKEESLLVSNSRASLMAEQFRQLRAAIGLFGKNNNHKRLLVTSSISGEGKSYISTNLAVSFALSGKKVLLIDLDIRNPRVSAVIGLGNEAGVVEYLTGTKKPHEIIKKTDFQNLYVIGAGGEADSAMELILSGKLNDLLAAVQNEFEYIIMDTSPIDPVTDAYVFSEYCDRTLFVVRHGYTPKTLVQLFDENNKVQALKNPVIVFNGVQSRGFLNGTYGYGYGYGYANVYRQKSRQDLIKKLEI
jgi:tyrosine-protein kinase Etk/Wzc